MEMERVITSMFFNATASLKGNLLVSGNCNFPTLHWREGFPIDPFQMDRSSPNPFFECLHVLVLTQIVEKPNRHQLFQRPTLLDLAFLRNEKQLQNIAYQPPPP